MGCDIHAFIEYAYDGETITNSFTDSELHIGRDYELFSLIAGVRGATSPIVSPRGFPDECIKNGDSSVFPSSWCCKEKFNDYGVDAHSATWLTLDELKLVRASYIKNNLEFSGSTDRSILALSESKPAMNSIFTYTFGEYENAGLYCSIVIMESLLKLCPTCKVRFVCWFDS